MLSACTRAAKVLVTEFYCLLSPVGLRLFLTIEAPSGSPGLGDALRLLLSLPPDDRPDRANDIIFPSSIEAISADADQASYCLSQTQGATMLCAMKGTR